VLSLTQRAWLRRRKRDRDDVGELLRTHRIVFDGPRVNTLNHLRRAGATRDELEAADQLLEELRAL
jgi:hypothetical protein